MLRSPSRAWSVTAGPAALPVALVLLFGLAVRLWLIHRYPPVFGADGMLRLAYADQIVLLHHLPLLQAIIHYVYAMKPDPMLVRYLVSLVGAAAGVAFYLVASELVPRADAFRGSLLFATSPLITPFSTVPYNDILMVGGLLGALYGMLTQRWWLASTSLGVACLSRYESWLMCPILAAVYLRERGWTSSNAIRAVALFSWAPIAWIAYNGGHTSPAGTLTSDGSVTPERLFRWIHVGYWTVRFTPIPVTILAVLGAREVVRSRLWRTRAYQVLAAYLVLFLIALLVSAHGTPPNPERFLATRAAFVPIVGLLILATLGLGALKRFQGLVVVACLLVGLAMSDRYVVWELAQPRFAVGLDVADYLRDVVGPDQHVAVLAKAPDGLPGAPSRLEGEWGPDVRAAGIAHARRFQATPLEYWQMVALSGLSRRRLHNFSSRIVSQAGRVDTLFVRPPPDRPMDWIVMWDDFEPTSNAEERLEASARRLVPTYLARRDSVVARVYRGPG